MTETKKLSELAAEVKIETHLVGETIRDENWKCDHWRCVLRYRDREMPVDFYMGVGNRKAPVWSEGPRWEALPDHTWRRYHFGKWQVSTGTPQPPKADDVLSSLLLDSTALNESFEDWAESSGYDTDSRKALALYLQCQAEGRKLQKLLGADFSLFAEADNDV